MKNLFLFILGIILLVSCEDNESLNPNFDDEALTELTERTVYVDGERMTVYLEETSNEFLVLNDDGYVSLSELADNKQLVFYLNGELNDFLIFTSKEKMKSYIESPDKYIELMNKVKELDPSMIKEVDKSPSADASGPYFTIATAHSLGGSTFTKYLGTYETYGNPHLRCNQYETNCIDFNDKISSFKFHNVYGEFYSGSFANPGKILIVDAWGTTIQANNLGGTAWNDVITAFWASAFVSYINLHTWPGEFYCSHSYNDPLCP